MSESRLYFKNLDAIRFIAAFMVFLSHAMAASYKSLHNTYLRRFLYTISNGDTGVSVFFVLSGFLITYLLISEYEANGRISIRNFYIRRILRIWPLYYAVIIFTFFICPPLKGLIGYANNSQANVLYYVTFLSNFDLVHVRHCFPGQGDFMQDVTWSVSVEEQFYLVWPLLFTFVPKKFWKYGIVSVIAASVFFRMANYNDPVLLHYSTLGVLMYLGFGGIVAWLIKSSLKVRTLFESASTKTHLVLFAISFSLLLWAHLIFTFKYATALIHIFAAVSFALIIAAQAMTTKKSALNLGRFSFADKWGKYTYGIYLIHPIVLTLINASLRMAHIPKDSFIIAIVIATISFCLTLLLSWFSYAFFESKFLVLKEKYAIIKTHN